MRENTLEEYLAFENYSNEKHEFIHGVIIAMTGGSINHARLVTQLAVQLGAQLKGSRCESFGSELRLRVAGEELILYPDASVVCGQPVIDITDKHAIINPTLIVEVTSPSSAIYDRGEKFGYYQLIDTLREYVLVSHTQRMVEVFRRGDDGTWELVSQTTTGKAALMSIGGDLDVE
jgi:Uma2 family endonuclease